MNARVPGQEQAGAASAARLALAFLQALANGLLRLDRETLRVLAELEGKVIRVCLGRAPDAPEVYVLPSGAGVDLSAQASAAPDVTLRAELPVLLRLFAGELPADGLGSAALEVEGDVELGRRLRRILRGIDIDWEEQAASFIGDVPAHQLGRMIRALAWWSREACTTLAADLRDYLQEERRLLAPRTRVEEFLEAVDALRLDAERLEARVRRVRERAPC